MGSLVVMLDNIFLLPNNLEAVFYVCKSSRTIADCFTLEAISQRKKLMASFVVEFEHVFLLIPLVSMR